MDLDPATGEPLGTAWLEDVQGFEAGVDPIVVPELGANLGHPILLPLESPDGGSAELRLLLVDDAGLVGFTRSVDPVTAANGGPSPTLFVPLARVDDPQETDVLAYFTPPTLLGAESLEALNAAQALEFGSFVPDLDPAVVYPLQPGEAWIYLAEEEEDGANARLRFEFVPVSAGEPTLILATRKTDLVPASLRFFWAATTRIRIRRSATSRSARACRAAAWDSERGTCGVRVSRTPRWRRSESR